MTQILMSMFDDVVVSPRDVIRGYTPEIPYTGWEPPRVLPDYFGNAVMLGIDCETRELEFDKGAGWGRGSGHIVGVSVAALFSDGHIESLYLPYRHELEPHLNLPTEKVKEWLRPLLFSHIDKVGANLQYDIGHLKADGMPTRGRMFDVQLAEALLSESDKVALEVLGEKYLGVGKETDLLYKWIREAYPQTPLRKTRGHIYHAPVTLVGKYAEQDAEMPIRILQKQWPILEQRGLLKVFDLECRLTPLLVDMRLAGVTVDVPFAERLKHELGVELQQEHRQLEVESGVKFNYGSSEEVADFLKRLGIKSPLTPTGKAKVGNDWLEALEHPYAKRIAEMRKKDKIIGTFLNGYIINAHVNGKVYGSFHQLRGESEGGTNGTRSGRLASSKPNLQNLPSRSKLAKRVREAFVPHQGHWGWAALDYSQIEYRMLCHFAVGAGSDEVRAQFCDDPTTDYHEYTQALVLGKTGKHLERKPIKSINFGLLYGMGKAKLGRQLGLDAKTTNDVFEAYHGGAPYVKATMDEAARIVHATGQMRTIYGRISYFDLWQPMEYDEDAMALPYHLAINRYGSKIKRAHEHKAVNRQLQGSAADQMKAGMVQAYESGVFDYTGLPTLSVHDELDFSIIDDSPLQQEAYAFIKHTMETAIPLRVPVIAECARGASWGTTQDTTGGVFAPFKPKE